MEKCRLKITIYNKKVPDRYKTKQIDQFILENAGTLEFLRGCYKNQQMYDKTIDNYSHALKCSPDFYMTQKICDNAVNTYHSTIQLAPDCYKTQEMCDKVVISCF